jgi:hypothetical protein
MSPGLPVVSGKHKSLFKARLLSRSAAGQPCPTQMHQVGNKKSGHKLCGLIGNVSPNHNPRNTNLRVNTLIMEIIYERTYIAPAT